MTWIWNEKYVKLVLCADFERIRKNGALPTEWANAIEGDIWTWRKMSLPQSLICNFSFAPSVEGIARLHSVGILFPDTCCVCGAPATRQLPLRPLSLREKFRAAIKCWYPVSVPHCEVHGDRYASLLFAADPPTDNFPFVYMIGLNRSFMVDTKRLNCGGEYYAPWAISRYYRMPGIGWGQGAEEGWWLHAWVPFWLSLPEDERQAYLKRWKADDDWREFLIEVPRWYQPEKGEPRVDQDGEPGGDRQGNSIGG
ncbi:MAG: hypothetical protein ACKV0T_31145 [Planctomycetales bacterium]